MDFNADLFFWDKVWKGIPLGNYYGIEKYLAVNMKMGSLYKRFLKKGNKRILEIGCARGKELIYFAKEFGYEIYGVDYSESGVALAIKNLKIAGVKGTILCQDIFRAPFQEEFFDIVYSGGLIEHFKDPSELIDAHVKLLRKGGKLIITIPNFKDSLSLALKKIIGKEEMLLATHNLSIMDKRVFRDLFQRKEIKILALGYFGPVDISPVFSIIRSKPVLYLAHLLNQIIGYATFFMPSSPYFSPYLVIICEKTEGK